MQNLYHTNVANYGMTHYQAPPGVSNHIHIMMRTIDLPINDILLVTHQNLADPYTYPTSTDDVGFAQRIPEHEQASFPVRANLSLPCMFSVGSHQGPDRNRTKVTSLMVIPPRVLYQAPPFLVHHLVTGPLL